MVEATDNEQIKQDIVALYSRYFGSNMANNYAKFYQDKDIPTVLSSARELVKEYAGENKGEEMLSEIYKKYSITPN